MTDEEIEKKFRGLTATVIDESRAEEIIRIVHYLDRCQKITDLTDLLSFNQ